MPWHVSLRSSSVRKIAPPAIWLRALSKMTLINESTPIPYSSPMILIKCPKMYNTGRLLHGHDHKFVRMRRTGAIRHLQFEAATFPAHFVLTLHISQERMIPSRSLNRQPLSNAPIHAGRRESRGILGKYLHSVTIACDGSN